MVRCGFILDYSQKNDYNLNRKGKKGRKVMQFLKEKTSEGNKNKKIILNILLSAFMFFALILQPLNVYAIDKTPQTGYCYKDLVEWIEAPQLEYVVEMPFETKITFYFIYTDVHIEIPEIGYSQQIPRVSDKEASVFETPIIPANTKCTVLIKPNGTSSKWFINGKIYIVPESELKVDDVQLSCNQKKLSVGEKFKLEEKHSPFFIEETDGSWKSSNTDVTYVNQKGEVIAKSMGAATISYSLYGKKTKCDISVKDMNVNMWSGESISLSKFVKNIPNYKKGKWKLNGNKVASISKSGRLKFKKPGKAKMQFIVGKSKYNFNIYSYKDTNVYGRAYDTLYSYLKYPASYSLNDVKFEYDSLYYSEIYLTIDYSAMNSLGGYVRNEFYFTGKNMKYKGEFLNNN